ncbi:2OG-Fe(II) oxygenase family protein [Dickeya dianthicola]|uniref:2OG-Fe(II) oxygenase family protein n=1 Tax=Dickeya dianthicola TaxID=204039 RepID=UPI0030166A0C
MRNDRLLFKKTGYLTTNIRSQFASKILEIMESAQACPEECWTYIYKNSLEQKDLSFMAPYYEIEQSFTRCFEDFCENKFSFFFRRLSNEVKDNVSPSEASTIAYNFCNSEEFKDLIAALTGRKIGNIDVFYINRFDKGHFLNTHTDAGNNIGIALNITENWDPNFGGLTHILDKEKTKIVETLTPGFAELFLFDTSGKQVPHFVSTVTANQKNRRMSVIARYGKA